MFPHPKSALFKRSQFFAFAALLVSFAAIVAFGQEKPKPEEIIARHLEAFGSTENRAPTRSRVLAGSSIVELKTGGRGAAEGPVTLSSQNDNVFIDANFEAPDFPYERISFDGKKVDVRQFKAGQRSPIGEYILSNDAILKEGLMGGVLSANWAPLHLEQRKPRLKYEGTEMIDGRSVHRIRYEPRRSANVKIKLFFDAETYRHVRTTFENEIAGQTASGPISTKSGEAMRRESRYKIIENFSDFASTGGLDLPKKYSMEFSVFSDSGPLLIEWTFQFSRFAFNQPVDLSNFKATKK
jgi:hypothetical protein